MTGTLLINLQDLLLQRTIEGERVEYKAGWNPQGVLHTVCAFANDFHNLGGGFVVLGVDESDELPALPPRGIDPGRIETLQGSSGFRVDEGAGGRGVRGSEATLEPCVTRTCTRGF